MSDSCGVDAEEVEIYSSQPVASVLFLTKVSFYTLFVVRQEWSLLWSVDWHSDAHVVANVSVDCNGSNHIVFSRKDLRQDAYDQEAVNHRH